MISAAVGISEIHILRFVNALTVSCSEERLCENCSLVFPTCEDKFSAAVLIRSVYAVTVCSIISVNCSICSRLLSAYSVSIVIC